MNRSDDGLTVRPARSTDADACVAVMGTRPDHFTAAAADELREDVDEGRVWLAELDATVVAVMSLHDRSATCVEIRAMAVRAEVGARGIGSAFLLEVLAHLERRGVLLVEVTTLDASADFEPYERTRRFWERHGFHQVDRIDPYPGWDEGNPCAIYVGALGRTFRSFGDARLDEDR